MFALQGHLSTLLQHVDNIFLVILTAQADEYPLIMLGYYELLKRLMRGVNLNTKCPDLSTNTLPKSSIAIQHNHLVWSALKAIYLASDKGSKCREEGWSIWDVAQFV